MFVKLDTAEVVALLVRTQPFAVVLLVALEHHCCHLMHYLCATSMCDAARVILVLRTRSMVV